MYVLGKDLKGRELGKGLSQRPNGLYEARAMIKGEKIDIYGENLKELKEAFERAKQEVLSGIDRKLKNITAKEWFEIWFDKYKKPMLKESSWIPTMSRYNVIFGDDIADKQMSNITGIMLQDIINKRVAEGRAVSSIRSATSTLRDCFASAMNNGVITGINPTFDLVVPWSESRKILRRFLDERERQLFLEQVENSYYKEMYHIMLVTGLRIGEVGGLQWQDVDFRKKVLHVQRSLHCNYHKGVKTVKLTQPKTFNSFREIPFMGDAEEMFLAWRDKQSIYKKELGNRWRSPEELGDLVFTTSMGSPVTRYGVEKDINRCVAEINARLLYNKEPQIEPIYPHALRHTFCSICFERGMNPKVVQQLMGHSSYSTTIDIYTHVTNKSIADDVAKFGDSVIRK